MIRRIFATIFFLAILFFWGARPALADESYSAENYNVTIVMLADGTLNVTETIFFRFGDESFTYVFRELELANLDKIDQVQASMDGQALPLGTQAGEVEIEYGKPIKVTWHFAPTSNSTHEFTLLYRVQGAIRKEATADVLIWRAIPEAHEYTIEHSLIRVEYPEAITPQNTPVLSGVSTESEAGHRAVVFTTQPIDADTAVDIEAHFPPGSLASQPPAWQTQQEKTDRQVFRALPFGLGAAGLTGLMGLISILLLAGGFRRQPGAVMMRQPGSTPPRSIPPALAAHLANKGTTYLGTLFDLARRGVVRIEEGPKKWGSRTFQIVHLQANEPLAPHEQVFVESIFRKAKEDRVDLSEISSLAYNSKFSEAINQELTAAGWRDPERITRRNRFLGLNSVVVVLGLLALGAGLLVGGISIANESELVIFAGVLTGTGAAASGIGVFGLLAAAFISTLSDEGVREAAARNGFAEVLHNLARGRGETTPELFERYLPFAAGFGIATEWAKHFQKMANLPLPAWFQGLQAGQDDGSFVVLLAAITSADSSVASATGSDAGSSASGGGASGAG